MKKHVLVKGLLLLLVIVLTACGTKGGSSASTAPKVSPAPASAAASTPASSAAPAQQVKLEIPLIAPFSGDVAFYGDGYQKGLNLALGEVKNTINGVQVSLKPYDDKCTPDEAVNQVLKIVDSAKLVIGPACTANTLAVQGKLNAAGIPHIGLNYGSVAYGKNDKTIFAGTPTDKNMTSALVQFAKEQGVKKWVLINATDAYSASGAAAFKAALGDDKDLQLLDSATFNGGNREFNGILLNVQKKNPDAIYVVGYEADAGLLVKQARQIGIKTTFYGNPVFTNKEFLDASGSASEGSYFVSVISPDDPYAPVQDFVKKFKAAYNSDPNDVATTGYNVGKIIISLLNTVGTDITKEKLATALRGLKVEGSPYGDISYNDDGSFKGSSLVVIGQIKSGKPTVIKRH